MSEKLIHVIMSAWDFISKAPANQRKTRQLIHEFVSDPDFVFNLKKCLRILEPIDRLIVYFQSDAVPVSDVYDSILKLTSQSRQQK